MKKILFLHGFFASGHCLLARTLRESVQTEAEVLSPDLPLFPQQALDQILELCHRVKPDLLVGNSCGAFYAQMVSMQTDTPALLGNPYFLMTEFLRDRLGEQQYKSVREDGKQHFIINENLIDEFYKIEQHQFDKVPTNRRDQVWGLFGENDTLAHFEPLFLKYYRRSFHFPGGHTPTAEEVKHWYAPLALQMLCLNSQP